MQVDDTAELVGELGELVIVRGKDGFGPRPGVNMLDDGPSDRQAVEGRGSASDFVEQNKARRRGRVQNLRGLRHLHHEG
ncbi:hypothetical protein D3C83_73390 [compost metagenome]